MKQHQAPAAVHPNPSEMPTMAAPTPTTKHYPAGLRYVRALFLRTEYRICAQSCADLLQTLEVRSHPVQKAFLHFYRALAYDEMSRAMHHNSIVKIPALDSAEQSYLAALHALPSTEDAELLCLSLARKPRADSVFDSGEPSPGHDGNKSFGKASLMSSPFCPSTEGSPVRSPTKSPASAASDLDDLESHDSFLELLTPSRIFKREYSQMSPLRHTSPVKDRPRQISGFQDHPAPTRMQRDFSRMSLLETPPRKPMSQGLLRPIRPGSAPKQFYIPPRLADTTQRPRARASKQVAEVTWNCSPRSSAIISRTSVVQDHLHNDPESVSPLSNLGPDRSSSSESPISTISPLTPQRNRIDSLSSDQAVNDGLLLRFNDHLDSMRMQLETHITLVRQAKEQLREFQAERALLRVAETIGTSLRDRPNDAVRNDAVRNDAGKAPTSSAGVTRIHSYWSFVPVDAKAAEKQKRIRDGKERNWARKTERFDPTKYQDLCERALNEL